MQQPPGWGPQYPQQYPPPPYHQPPGPPPPTKWHQSAGFVVLSLFCCWPAGLALLWTSPAFSKNAKVGLSAAVGGLLFIGAVSAALGPKKERDDAQRPAVEAQAPQAKAPAEPQPEPPPRPAPPPAIQIAARDILAAYKANEVRADAQFKGKTAEISGIVGDIKKDILDSIYVTIGTGAAFEIPMVQAFFDDEHANQAANLSKGDKVTVRCRIDGLMMNVLARDCEFVK